MRKSRTRVASTTAPTAHHTRSATVAVKSRMPEAWPTTQDSNGGRSVRSESTSSREASPVPLSPVWKPTVTTPSSRVRTGSTDSTPGRSAAVAAHDSTSAAGARATTVTWAPASWG